MLFLALRLLGVESETKENLIGHTDFWGSRAPFGANAVIEAKPTASSKSDLKKLRPTPRPDP